MHAALKLGHWAAVVFLVHHALFPLLYIGRFYLFLCLLNQSVPTSLVDSSLYHGLAVFTPFLRLSEDRIKMQSYTGRFCTFCDQISYLVR